MINLEEYRKLNASFHWRNLVFHMGCDSGFYSEFNNMVLALIYCMQSRIRFSMYSADANFGYKKGWTDYFLPFCEEETEPFHHRFNKRSEDPWFCVHGLDRWKYLYWRLKHKRTYLTFDVFCKFRMVSFPREHFSISELDLDGNLQSVARQVINMVYRFNDKTLTEILGLVGSLNLPKEYVGFHIRGGDKFVEHELEQYAAYISKAEAQSSLRDAFVLTDDYRIIDGLKRDYPGWHFYTLTLPEERGYFHEKFQKQPTKDRKSGMIKLFSAMEILRHANLVVGTFSSNPGMFLGLCRDDVYGVDFDKWLLW